MIIADTPATLGREPRHPRGADIPGLLPRTAALRLLDAALRRGETLEAALSATSRGLGEADRALAHALAAEALRWLIDLDALIDSATRQPLPPDAKARAVLRLMLAGWLRLQTPPHAVLATALPLLAGGPRRLAHGVFAALVRRAVALPTAPSLPEAVAARWVAAWGEARVQAIAAGLASPPPLDITLRAPLPTSTPAPELAALGGQTLMPGHLRLPRGLKVTAIPGFAQGQWWVQDLAASLPARLLCLPVALGNDAPPRVLDLCAAPGGKTLQLAAAGWQVTALDASERRLARLRANLARMALTAEVICADALHWVPETPYTAILIDAPCTATGTCRRHPEVLHRVDSAAIAAMATLQAGLLTRAADWLIPGGRLVYAACSLEPEEGEAHGALIARLGLSPDPILPEELPKSLAPIREGWLRTDPGMLSAAGGLDGFFIGRWRRPE